MTVLTFTVLWKGLTAEKGMKQLGDTTKKTSKDFAGFGKIAATAGLVAGAALIKFGKDAVKAYAEAEQSQAKLQDAFARFPKLADTNIEALRGLNSELAKKTRFDDDATASGQAVLAQFDLTGKEITQLTPLLQDYAAKTGRDLPTAAKLLGKAVMGNGRALKEVGIDFKDTGDRGKNFEQIMGGLRTQVGGFAEKEGKTAAGQVEILKNQFGELQEEAGSKLLPTLNKMVGGVTKAVIAFGELEPGVKGAIGGFTIALPTLLLAAGGVTKIASSAKAAKAALDGMSASAKKATFAAAGIAAGIGILAVAFGAWAAKNAEAKQTTSDLTDALVASNGAIDDNIFKTKAKALQDDDSAKKAEELGINLDTLTRAHLGEADAIAEVNGILDSYIANGTKQIQTSRGLVRTTTVQAEAARKLQEDLKAGNVTLEEAKKRAQDLGTATKSAGGWIYDAGKKSKDSAKEIDEFADSMFNATKKTLALSDAQIGYEQSVDDATRAAKTNKKTLDLNTQAGRDNKRALDNQVTSSQNYIRELVRTTGNSKKVEKATKDAKEEFVRNAQKMGVSRNRAEELADKYFKLDKNINNLNDKKITIKFGAGSYSIGGVKYSVNLTSPSSVGRKAAGGPVHGPGTATSDSIPMMLSDGEFVVNAKATKRHRNLLEQINAASLTGKSFKHDAAPRGMASGGVVTHSPASGIGGAASVPGQAAKYRDAIAQAIGKDIGSRAAKKIAAWQNTMGGGGGVGTIPAGPGWGPVYAAARRAGARSFTTYAGHDQGASRSRDIWPPSWAVANAIRRLQSVWYTIYSRRIASVTRANRAWLPYHGSNPHTDHVHVTLRPGFNKGGEVKNNLAKAGVPPNLVRVSSGGHGGGPGGQMGGDTYIINAPNYVGDKKDLVKALTDLNRQGRLEVIRR